MESSSSTRDSVSGLSEGVLAGSGRTFDAKIVVLGSQGVGKTSLVLRFIQNSFIPNNTSTIGASFVTKRIDIRNTLLRLQIWDTAGSERFRSLVPLYYRGADAAILAFDVNNEASMMELRYWIEDFRKWEPTADIYLVGTKCDSPGKKVEMAKVMNLAQIFGIDKVVYETSAKQSIGVAALFLQISKRLLEKFDAKDQVVPSKPLTLTENPSWRPNSASKNHPPKSSCCS